MANRVKKQPPEEPEKGRKGRVVQVYLPQELAAALVGYVDVTKPRPTMTAVIEMAVEEFLRRAGAYPPPSDQ